MTGAVTNELFVLSIFAACHEGTLFLFNILTSKNMLRDQLVSKCVGIILDAVREERGNLRFVSDEARVNREYFNRKRFGTLKFFRIIRVLYCLAMLTERKTFVAIGEQIFAEIWEMEEDYGYDLLDEYKLQHDEKKL